MRGKKKSRERERKKKVVRKEERDKLRITKHAQRQALSTHKTNNRGTERARERERAKLRTPASMEDEW